MILKEFNSIDIEKVARPIWENLVAANKVKSYEMFSLHFSESMRKGATREEIEKQWQEQPMLCNLSENAEYMGNLRNSGGIRILWKQKIESSSDEFLGHLELIIENGEVKVNGAQIL